MFITSYLTSPSAASNDLKHQFSEIVSIKNYNMSQVRLSWRRILHLPVRVVRPSSNGFQGSLLAILTNPHVRIAKQLHPSTHLHSHQLTLLSPALRWVLVKAASNG